MWPFNVFNMVCNYGDESCEKKDLEKGDPRQLHAAVLQTCGSNQMEEQEKENRANVHVRLLTGFFACQLN